MLKEATKYNPETNYTENDSNENVAEMVNVTETYKQNYKTYKRRNGEKNHFIANTLEGLTDK